MEKRVSDDEIGGTAWIIYKVLNNGRSMRVVDLVTRLERTIPNFSGYILIYSCL